MKAREVRFAEGADDDLVRLHEFLAEKDTRVADRALATIRSGLTMASRMPYTCRKAAGSTFVRECVIPFGKTGYVAAFQVADDHILVLGIRHQREDDTD